MRIERHAKLIRAVKNSLDASEDLTKHLSESPPETAEDAETIEMARHAEELLRGVYESVKGRGPLIRIDRKDEDD